MMNTMSIALMATIVSPCLSLAVPNPVVFNFDSISRECYLKPFIGFATAPGGIDAETLTLPVKLTELGARVNTAFFDTTKCAAIRTKFVDNFTTWSENVQQKFDFAVTFSQPVPDLTDAELYTFVPDMLDIFNDKSTICPCMATMSALDLQERVFKSVTATNCTLDFKTVGEWINFCGDDNNMLAMEGVCALACSSVDSDKLATTTFGSCSDSSTCCECASDEFLSNEMFDELERRDVEGSGFEQSPTTAPTSIGDTLSSNDKDDDKKEAGRVAGIVIGVLLLIIILVVIVFVLISRGIIGGKNKKVPSTPPSETSKAKEEPDIVPDKAKSQNQEITRISQV